MKIIECGREIVDCEHLGLDDGELTCSYFDIDFRRCSKVDEYSTGKTYDSCPAEENARINGTDIAFETNRAWLLSR